MASRTARKTPPQSSGRRAPLRTTDAAAYTGMSRKWLLARAEAGDIPYIKTNYALLFRPEDLDRYLEEHTVVVKPRSNGRRKSKAG
ncbi:MAG: helix-turn-helix domain-containing protein [Actinomycetota bacterium]